MKPVKYIIVLRTVDRAPEAENYLFKTLANLERAGLFRSSIPFQLVIFSDREAGGAFQAELADWRLKYPDLITVEKSDKRLTPNQNAAWALHHASIQPAQWVLFLEDDVDFCADFLESVDVWRRRVEHPDIKLYSLCAAYEGVRLAQVVWEYPVKDFYGTQAYLLRHDVAVDLAEFLSKKPKWKGKDKGHDMLLKEWAGKKARFVAAAPNFIQHIGKQSSLHLGRFHDYPSWPGQDWSFLREAAGNSMFTVEEQQSRPFSDALAKALVQSFPKDKPVHDLGCSLGHYVKALREGGLDAHGYEGTPGISAHAVVPVNWAELSSPMHPGNYGNLVGSVLCLEVAEHIPAERADVFLKNVAEFCVPGGKLVLSWAVKGQGGRRHVNEQNWDHVLPTMRKHGFVYQRGEALELRKVAGAQVKWFAQSLYVFTKV
ncbi:MAG TPA: hypothetical protein VGH19_06755 [Verrucomicrobiae bacterium]